MIWKDIPRAYVEDYDQINDLANGYPKCVKVILSSTGWYFDEVFKFWAASAKNSGVLLAGIPHGGNFGSSKILPREDHELSVVNRYYTWGWKINGEKSSLTIPKPAPRLMSRLESSYKSKKFQILWATTDIQRYSVFPDSIFGKKNNYLDWQEKFSSKLNQTVRKNLVLRPHREIDDFDIALNIKKYIPEITIENFDTFDNSLKKCRLYICDHLSTTFTESLSVNKPTILFWNPIYNPLRGEALKFYELLMQAGILFHDPISAANAVNDVSNNIEEWWMEGKRQDLVREFCRNHAYTSTDYRVQWSREVKMLLNGKL
jgi:putative transferase (TIGR04331 family)